MRVVSLEIPEVKVIEPKIFQDARGYFFESFNHRQFEMIIGQKVEFVQDNQSLSMKNVLRGLHYQIENTQGKLLRVLSGEVFDVAVDIRRSSPTFGKWVGENLSADNKRQLWIPPGFAHGFLVLSDSAEVLYKTTDYYAPQHERCIAWNDESLNIRWPLGTPPVLSKSDELGEPLITAELFK